MQRSTTLANKSDSALTPPQLEALAALGAGANVTSAAERAGVDRTTVQRWLRQDCAFQAAWNGLRPDLRCEVQAGLDQLVGAALQAVQDAVTAGDARVGLAVLKGTGILQGVPQKIGPEDADTVDEAARLAANEAVSERFQRSLLVL